MSMMGGNLETIWLQFKELLENGDRGSYPSFFFDYYRNLVDRSVFEKHVLNVEYLFRLSETSIRGSRILDAGCGFGMDCVILAAMGASEVHGVDSNESWIETFQNYLRDFKWELPITPKVGDASRLPYPDAFFDVLLSVESVSHYRDVDSFFTEAHRVLRRDGVLIISDANNGSNPCIRRKTYKIWERFENGPPTDCFYGHSIKKSYRRMREEIISSQFPQLEETQTSILAEHTFGLGRDEVIRNTERYIKEDILPKSKYERGKPSFNPVMNDYIERLFKPQDLAEQMRAHGFRANMFSHFGGAGAKNILSNVNSFLRFFTPITIYLAPGYKIVGVKEHPLDKHS